MSLLLLILPYPGSARFGLGRAYASGHKGRSEPGVLRLLEGSATCRSLNLLSFLTRRCSPIDAIVRSLVRRSSPASACWNGRPRPRPNCTSTERSPVDRYLALAPLYACGVAIVVYLAHAARKRTFHCGADSDALGPCHAVTAWLNAPPREEKQQLGARRRGFPARPRFAHLALLSPVWRSSATTT